MLLRIFGQFFRYLKFHFNEEEYCTVLIDFNMWQANRREHIEFMESLTSIMNKIYSGEIHISFAALRFVSDLYIEHIFMSDRSIVACLNKQFTPVNGQNKDTL